MNGRQYMNIIKLKRNVKHYWQYWEIVYYKDHRANYTILLTSCVPYETKCLYYRPSYVASSLLLIHALISSGALTLRLSMDEWLHPYRTMDTIIYLCPNSDPTLDDFCMKGHFAYVPSQWEPVLKYNVVSYWLGSYTKRSLVSNRGTCWNGRVIPTTCN